MTSVLTIVRFADSYRMYHPPKRLFNSLSGPAALTDVVINPIHRPLSSKLPEICFTSTGTSEWNEALSIVSHNVPRIIIVLGSDLEFASR